MVLAKGRAGLEVGLSAWHRGWGEGRGKRQIVAPVARNTRQGNERPTEDRR